MKTWDEVLKDEDGSGLSAAHVEALNASVRKVAEQTGLSELEAAKGMLARSALALAQVAGAIEGAVEIG